MRCDNDDPGNSTSFLSDNGAGPMVKTKRVYEGPDPHDGMRVLVDRLWPRGVSKERASVDRWEKEIAPSDELRRWFGHEPEKWQEFRKRYLVELEGKRELVEELASAARGQRVTLLFAASDQEHNNAVVLKELIESSHRK